MAFIKVALKRMLYSFLVAKSKFNLVKFATNGRPMLWERELVPPTAHKLRDAEGGTGVQLQVCIQGKKHHDAVGRHRDAATALSDKPAMPGEAPASDCKHCEPLQSRG